MQIRFRVKSPGKIVHPILRLMLFKFKKSQETISNRTNKILARNDTNCFFNNGHSDNRFSPGSMSTSRLRLAHVSTDLDRPNSISHAAPPPPDRPSNRYFHPLLTTISQRLFQCTGLFKLWVPDADSGSPAYRSSSRD